MKAIAVLLGALLVTGCASHTGITPIGGGSFMIAKQQATGFPGLGNMKADLLREGHAHCAAMKKNFELTGATETQPPYILGNYPRSEITFRCT